MPRGCPEVRAITRCGTLAALLRMRYEHRSAATTTGRTSPARLEAHRNHPAIGADMMFLALLSVGTLASSVIAVTIALLGAVALEKIAPRAASKPRGVSGAFGPEEVPPAGRAQRRRHAVEGQELLPCPVGERRMPTVPRGRLADRRARSILSARAGTPTGKPRPRLAAAIDADEACDEVSCAWR
ncbi:MAG: hypothetical protein QM604_11400 [Microbacterium sp.]